MKKFIVFSFIPVLAGCLTASAPKVSQWILEYQGAVRTAQVAKYDVGRVSQVLVRSPYNEVGIAVLKADGSVAFDPYNEYAANPTAMLKGMVSDAMSASGIFGSVVNASSSVKSSAMVEAFFTRLALDCREEGTRRASVAVIVRVLGSNERAGIAKGEGVADAADGNFGAALSAAASTALRSAFDQLR